MSGLNVLQLLMCQLILLKHVDSDGVCIDLQRQFMIELTKHAFVI